MARGIKLALLVFAVSLGIGLIENSHVKAAQPALSFTTSPVSFGINVRPGTSETQQLEIMNNGNTPVTIQMEVKTFSAYGDQGQAAISNFSTNSPVAKYVKLSPSSFIAEPKVWSKVSATISLPASAQLGYYFTIVFQPILNASNSPGTSVVLGSNAILVLVDTGSANEVRSVSVANFSATHGLYEYLPVTFNVNLRNKGNIFLAPSGDIFISRNSNGTKTIASLTVNKGGGNVLPNSNRIFSASWTSGFPVFLPETKNGSPVLDKKGNPVLHLTWNFSQSNKFRFGKYYAILALQYNNGQREVLLNSTVSFWVLPWKLMIIALIILLLFLYGIFLIIRGILRRFRKPKKQIHPTHHPPHPPAPTYTTPPRVQ